MSSTRRKNPVKKKTIIKIAIAAIVVLAAILVLVLVLRSRVSSEFASKDETEVQSASVTAGSISTTVSGSGTLSNEDSEDTFIPATVEVTEICVKAGETVEEGQMLASINSVSVVTTMKSLQDEIDAIDEEIEDLEGVEIDDTITAGVSGRVKKIYAAEGDSTADVMVENQALMLLSADGKMAVELETDALSKGDSVTVTDEDGNTYDGTVDSIWAGTATILISDESADVDAAVTVTKDGNTIGTGNLTIHEQVAVTGFAGTIETIKVSENEKVSSGTTLLTLTDLTDEVSYAALLEERQEKEDELENLIVIYKEGAVYAKESGMVTAITETSDSTTTTTTANMSAFGGSQTQTSVVDDSESEDGTTISICPTDSMLISLSVDETDILSLEIGQTAQITISSLGEDTYEGVVTDLDTVGSSSSGVTTYTAEVTLDKADGMLAGMSASTSITIEGKDDALLVPVDAVHKTSSTYYVYTSYDEETGTFGDMVEVTVGLSNSSYMEITSGLSEGDTVYYTENQDDNSFSFGDFSSFGSFGGGNMPSGNSFPSGGNTPSGMPSFN